jgi:predicted pyridoxine 5'-phosphate oxidase superfamily flavin-nucleotide-binding protein
MDYARRRRIKIWGRARVVESDAALLSRLMPEGYAARPEAVILFHITAWDMNCPQHIPQKIDADQVAAALAGRDAEIARLRTEIATLKNGKGDTP